MFKKIKPSTAAILAFITYVLALLISFVVVTKANAEENYFQQKANEIVTHHFYNEDGTVNVSVKATIPLTPQVTDDQRDRAIAWVEVCAHFCAETRHRHEAESRLPLVDNFGIDTAYSRNVSNYKSAFFDLIRDEGFSDFNGGTSVNTAHDHLIAQFDTALGQVGKKNAMHYIREIDNMTEEEFLIFMAELCNNSTYCPVNYSVLVADFTHGNKIAGNTAEYQAARATITSDRFQVIEILARELRLSMLPFSAIQGIVYRYDYLLAK